MALSHLDMPLRFPRKSMNKNILAFIATAALLVPSLAFAASPPRAELLSQIKELPKGAVLDCTSHLRLEAGNQYLLATGLFDYAENLFCNINGYPVKINAKVFLGDSLGKFKVLSTSLHETNDGAGGSYTRNTVTFRKMN